MSGRGPAHCNVDPGPPGQSIAQVPVSTVWVRPSMLMVSLPAALVILVAPGNFAVHACAPPAVVMTSWGCPSASSSRAKFVPTTMGSSPTPARTVGAVVVAGGAVVGCGSAVVVLVALTVGLVAAGTARDEVLVAAGVVPRVEVLGVDGAVLVDDDVEFSVEPSSVSVLGAASALGEVGLGSMVPVSDSVGLASLVGVGLAAAASRLASSASSGSGWSISSEFSVSMRVVTVAGADLPWGRPPGRPVPLTMNRTGLVGVSIVWKRGWTHAEGHERRQADYASI